MPINWRDGGDDQSEPGSSSRSNAGDEDASEAGRAASPLPELLSGAASRESMSCPSENDETAARSPGQGRPRSRSEADAGRTQQQRRGSSRGNRRTSSLRRRNSTGSATMRSAELDGATLTARASSATRGGEPERRVSSLPRPRARSPAGTRSRQRGTSPARASTTTRRSGSAPRTLETVDPQVLASRSRRRTSPERASTTRRSGSAPRTLETVDPRELAAVSARLSKMSLSANSTSAREGPTEITSGIFQTPEQDFHPRLSRRDSVQTRSSMSSSPGPMNRRDSVLSTASTIASHADLQGLQRGGPGGGPTHDKKQAGFNYKSVGPVVQDESSTAQTMKTKPAMRTRTTTSPKTTRRSASVGRIGTRTASPGASARKGRRSSSAGMRTTSDHDPGSGSKKNLQGLDANSSDPVSTWSKTQMYTHDGFEGVPDMYRGPLLVSSDNAGGGDGNFPFLQQGGTVKAVPPAPKGKAAAASSASASSSSAPKTAAKAGAATSSAAPKSAGKAEALTLNLTLPLPTAADDSHETLVIPMSKAPGVPPSTPPQQQFLTAAGGHGGDPHGDPGDDPNPSSGSGGADAGSPLHGPFGPPGRRRLSAGDMPGDDDAVARARETAETARRERPVSRASLFQVALGEVTPTGKHMAVTIPGDAGKRVTSPPTVREARNIENPDRTNDVQKVRAAIQQEEGQVSTLRTTLRQQERALDNAWQHWWENPDQERYGQLDNAVNTTKQQIRARERTQEEYRKWEHWVKNDVNEGYVEANPNYNEANPSSRELKYTPYGPYQVRQTEEQHVHWVPVQAGVGSSASSRLDESVVLAAREFEGYHGQATDQAREHYGQVLRDETIAKNFVDHPERHYQDLLNQATDIANLQATGKPALVFAKSTTQLDKPTEAQRRAVYGGANYDDPNRKVEATKLFKKVDHGTNRRGAPKEVMVATEDFETLVRTKNNQDYVGTQSIQHASGSSVRPAEVINGVVRLKSLGSCNPAEREIALSHNNTALTPEPLNATDQDLDAQGRRALHTMTSNPQALDRTRSLMRQKGIENVTDQVSALGAMVVGKTHPKSREEVMPKGKAASALHAGDMKKTKLFKEDYARNVVNAKNKVFLDQQSHCTQGQLEDLVVDRIRNEAASSSSTGPPEPKALAAIMENHPLNNFIRLPRAERRKRAVWRSASGNYEEPMFARTASASASPAPAGTQQAANPAATPAANPAAVGNAPVAVGNIPAAPVGNIPAAPVGNVPAPVGNIAAPVGNAPAVAGNGPAAPIAQGQAAVSSTSASASASSHPAPPAGQPAAPPAAATPPARVRDLRTQSL
ncbi:unnamed protein product [Amoebophrya sp. A120]|nr:unnamed protein product [Amoebophrya sp. A120]|eukprot:GSA120T00025305001.1